jgi:transcriptional antiterminator NusG
VRQPAAFDVEDEVRVCEGPFASFRGTIMSVDETNERVGVEVSIFGRPTPVELEFGQVEKL